MSASEYVTILGLEGQFLVPRRALLEVEYFQRMSARNAESLYLPFTKKVIREILGVVLHEQQWNIDSEDPNVLLGLRFCGLIEEPEAPFETFPAGAGGYIASSNQEIIGLKLPTQQVDTIIIRSLNTEIFRFGPDSPDSSSLTQYFTALPNGTLSATPLLLRQLNEQKKGRLEVLQYYQGKQVPGLVKISFQADT